MKRLGNTLVLAALFVATGGLYASAAGKVIHSRCNFCGVKTCKLNVEKVKEKTTCFEIECKDVCIPPITFPWQCRPAKCGKIRTVKVLKEKEGEKEVCKYSWEVVVICPSCRHGLEEAGCDVAPGVIIAESAEALK